MSDKELKNNITNENSSEYDEKYEEEYKKAMEKLNTSKSSRVKKITDDKKKEKKAQLKEKNSFLAKCKADPVIPVCIIAAVLVFIGAMLYFILPNFLVKTLDKTVPEFRLQYNQTEIYSQLMSSFNFFVTEPVYQQSTIEGDDKLDYFTCALSGNSSLNVAIQGSSSRNNGEITALRILMQPSSADGFANTMKMVYASFLQVFYPNMSIDEALSTVASCMNQVNGTEPTAFTVNGDYAYRFLIAEDNGNYVFVFDIIPAGNI